KMADAIARAGRRPEEVLLCAASKTRTPETVRLSAELDIDLFGENHVQELVTKTDAGAYLGKPAHMIGHLQTNKVKQTVGRAALIQSVDSDRLLAAIQKEAAKQALVQDVLLEVNIGGEASKSGVAPEELWALLETAEAMENVRVTGLMAIPPADLSEDDARRAFAAMRELFERAACQGYARARMEVLSMGMSDDFAAAILEGSTMVRVGTAIYGARYYPPKV
ncbi:MAG: YggS family pyridoxal phosphate-dependent enzyme, partial [Oscillospiraceae bacterium]|nr:YggS family pyridoxal phosphate-dependent enzyme [Oscillospiraceae bacterium]